jgi:hypothetical protein
MASVRPTAFPPFHRPKSGRAYVENQSGSVESITSLASVVSDWLEGGGGSFIAFSWPNNKQEMKPSIRHKTSAVGERMFEETVGFLQQYKTILGSRFRVS